MDAKQMLSTKTFKTIFIVGFVIIAPFSLYLLPGEASATKDMRAEQAKLDNQLFSVRSTQKELNAQIKLLQDREKKIINDRSDIETKINEKTTIKESDDNTNDKSKTESVK